MYAIRLDLQARVWFLDLPGTSIVIPELRLGPQVGGGAGLLPDSRSHVGAHLEGATSRSMRPTLRSAQGPSDRRSRSIWGPIWRGRPRDRSTGEAAPFGGPPGGAARRRSEAAVQR